MSDSRELILNTAFRLFLEKSYHEVTMQDIVKATGLSKGAFYHYFNSKEMVFEEIIEWFFKDVYQISFAGFSQNSLWEFCEDYLKMIAERVYKYANTDGVMRTNQYSLFFDASKIFPQFRDKQKRRQEFELQEWINIIAKARQSGEIASPLSDEQIAKLFIYQNYGIGVYNVLRAQVDELLSERSNQFKAIYELLRK